MFAVGCTLHGESDDEYCDYKDIPLQRTFNASLFTGLWYTHYKLRYVLFSRCHCMIGAVPPCKDRTV